MGTLSDLPATNTQNFNSAVRTVLNEWKESIEGKASSTHTHDGGDPSLHKIVANEANLGTGAQDGELAICTDNGNRYTWDDGNSKWRIMPGNIYSSAPSSSTYTIETGTAVMIAGVYKRWDGTAFVPVAPPSDLIQGGVISNNAADPDHDIDIAPIGCWDSNREVWMETDVTVTIAIDSVGLNGRDAGTLDADTIYHPYMVYNPSTGGTGFVFSLSNTAPTLTDASLSGYTKYRHISAYVWTDSSGNLKPFSMRGDKIFFLDRDDMHTVTGVSSTSFVAIDLTSYLPAGHYHTVLLGAWMPSTVGGDSISLSTNGSTTIRGFGSSGSNYSNSSFYALGNGHYGGAIWTPLTDDNKIYIKTSNGYMHTILACGVQMKNRS